MTCRLRRLREDDLERVRCWRMLPHVTRHIYTDPQITPEQQQAWFERISRSSGDRVWVIEMISELTPIGLLSLADIDPDHRSCSWAYYIGDDAARGKGLAKVLELNIYRYVFEVMGFNRLWCEVLSSNDRVVKLHERFGSRIEGVMRQQVLKNGTFHDVVRMAVLAADWPHIRNKRSFTQIEVE